MLLGEPKKVEVHKLCSAALFLQILNTSISSVLLYVGVSVCLDLVLLWYIPILLQVVSDYNTVTCGTSHGKDRNIVVV